jgi:NADH dehydrogenase FAD-containing subunit
VGEPHVVIVGGGFGGLSAARALRRAPVRVTLIDRSNHHLFQPLLYQVATTLLSPAQIAAPIRALLRRQGNTSVLLAEVTGVDVQGRRVVAQSSDGVHRIPYDFLVLATGVQQSYFGHDEFERFAPGLKSLGDAVVIRNRILSAFELAEAHDDPIVRQELLTFVLVGAGPTGVEMAGAIATLIRNTLWSEYRRIDPRSAHVVIVDRDRRILPTFSEDLSRAAHERLVRIGVDIRLGGAVENVDASGVVVAGERISSRTVIWTAGVEASPAARWLGAEADRAGRVRIQPDLTIPSHPEVFVIGDVASLDHNGRPLPGVAQVAMQQGRYVARVIRGRLASRPVPPPFTYFDKGNMAVVGRNFAIVESGRMKMSGALAFFAWAGIHLGFLAHASLRLMVFVQWVWTYVTKQTGSRLIVEHRPVANRRVAAAQPAAGDVPQLTALDDPDVRAAISH